MSAYSGIAPYYDRIFPFDEVQVGFLQKCIKKAENRGFLDVGCATGIILEEFAPFFERLVGLDLDTDLLDLAEERLSSVNAPKIELVEADMRDIARIFENESFDFISCLGNTLPHLTLGGEIASFFREIHALLCPKGSFVFQIVNYDRILDNKIRILPEIVRDDISFERYYSAPQKNGCIDFDICLIDSLQGIEIKQRIPLLPVRTSQIESCIRNSGFSHYEFFGDYAGAAYTSDSFLLIGVCAV